MDKGERSIEAASSFVMRAQGPVLDDVVGDQTRFQVPGPNLPVACQVSASIRR
jgi:hypothetical protein